MLARARTHSSSRSAAVSLRPSAVQDGRGPRNGTDTLPNFRMDRLGPPIGAITALARLPSRIRASTNGRSRVSSRPTLAAMRCASSATSSDSRNATSARIRRPARSTKTSFEPFTSTSVTSGSSRSGCSGPKPKSSAHIASSSPSATGARAAARTRSRRSARRAGSAYSASKPDGSMPTATSARTRATSAGSVTPERAGASRSREGSPPGRRTSPRQDTCPAGSRPAAESPSVRRCAPHPHRWP